MIEKQEITDVVNKWLEDKEYFLVDVQISADSRIVVEIDHRDGVWIDDCVNLSRYLEETLGERLGDYELEVGSAGLGQPFKVLRQYEAHVGSSVEVCTKDGRKLHGVLQSASEEGFTLLTEVRERPEGAKRPRWVGHELHFTYDEIKYTKYLISFK